ncbi:MAG TPA: isochorismatase family cysteine hydrolase [Bryobacteraceae bacterium]|nr:isochorismatase family cysteine hydrolase [Bryobacteraceae bacterium]
MPTQPGAQHDLHGSAPDTHHTCLLLIDVINDFEFPRGDELFEQARHIAAPIAALKQRAHSAGVPCVYVNDNFGQWRSSFEAILNHALRPNARGRDFVRQLTPQPEDYFVLKPKHSAFYQTPLELLLKHLGTERLILTGVSSNSCVLCTANDAYMRDLALIIPPDCIAACNHREHCYALEHMRDMLKAEILESERLDPEFLSRPPQTGSPT